MIGCIIQARMGSSRLPGKVMELVDGKNPSLYYTVNQIKNVETIEKIVIATSKNSEDDIICNYAKKNDIEYFRGSDEDVLDRYYQCAKESGIEKIVRITGDCPLIDPEIVTKVIEEFENEEYDYIQNLEPRTFPDGMDVEIFSLKILKEAWENAKLPSEREHVTAYFRNNEDRFQIKNFTNIKDLSHYRLTLDYKEDLELVRVIIKKIKKRPILMNDVLEVFLEIPKLFNVNNKYEANEGYKLSLEKDKEFLEKKK